MSYLLDEEKRYEMYSKTVFDNCRVYDNKEDKWLTIDDMVDVLNEKEVEETRLFKYFAEFFEEERAIYREDFNRMWYSIKKGIKWR